MEQAKIGDRFECFGSIYEVQKEVNQCEGCSFYVESDFFCSRPDGQYYCSAFNRDDYTSVIFKLIAKK